MKPKQLVIPLLVAVFLLPAASSAESKKTKADRALAKELSASLVVLSSQIETFADIRDQLAKSRVRTMQTLQNNLVWIQEGNDFDVRAWRVVGDSSRVDLFQAVLDATEDIAARRRAAVEREARQARRRATTRSAVNRRTGELGSAASSLAALGEPPISGQAVARLVQESLSQLAASVGEDSAKLKQGLAIASQLAGAVESRLPSREARE